MVTKETAIMLARGRFLSEKEHPTSLNIQCRNVYRHCLNVVTSYDLLSMPSFRMMFKAYHNPMKHNLTNIS